jgi:threonine aldolase
MRHAADVVVEGIASGLAAAKPGALARDVHAAWTSTIERHGLYKDSRCGYAVGLNYPPDWGERTISFRSTDDTVLEPNMTLHFMPGIWLDDWGIAISEAIRITETGPEPFCEFPRRLCDVSNMNFASDNITGVAPEIMARLFAENGGDCLPYGEDPYTKRVGERFDEAFEAKVGVMLVSTGTASNALALASVCPPYGAIFCRRESHIELEEGGAVEHLSGGAKLVPLDGVDGKIAAESLEAAILAYSPAAYFYRPAAVSITQVTEIGTVYSLAEIRAIADVARRYGLKLHVDGARFANAVASQNCSLAEMSWKAGVDVLSFGATKNGALAAEAVVFFEPRLMLGAAERRKRAGMLWSKHRFLAVQWDAYLADGLWLRLASVANDRAGKLARGLAELSPAELVYPVQANEAFVRLPDRALEAWSQLSPRPKPTSLSF